LQHFLHILDRLLRMHGFLMPFVLLLIGVVMRSGRKLLRRITSGHERDWPTTSAKIEIVSVAEQIREGRYSTETTGYLATLSYFYRDPELQMGEYTRQFPLQAPAQHWAEQFKDRQVVVHLNPKDRTDSVLLTADLEDLAAAPALSLDEAVRMEKLPRLKRGYLVLSGFSELIALAGLCLSAVALWRSLSAGALPSPNWLLWTGAGMLAFTAASTWIVTYRAEDSSSYQAFLHAYTLWCPMWMRWGVKILGIFIAALWFVQGIRTELPAEAQTLLLRIAPHTLYLLGCWGFLTTAATHTAILRSQELTRTATGENPLEGSGWARSR
jgi:hypothetical protein